MRGILATTVVCLLTVLAAPRAWATAEQYRYQVLLDTDNNPATGCDVLVNDTTGGSRPFPGVERLVTLMVTRDGADRNVTAIGVQSCSNGAFGTVTPVSAGVWPVGAGDGTGGGDVLEGFAPLAGLGGGGLARVAFTASRNGLSDVLPTVDGQPDGPPVLFLLPFHTPAPLLSHAALALCTVLLAVVAFRQLRRRAGAAAAVALAVCLATAALAATIVMDGQVGDWSGLSAVATDQTHDSTNNDPAEDIVAAFLTHDDVNLYFRIDVVTTEDLCAGLVCTASDQCKQAGSCDPYTGTCTPETAKPDDTACNDGSLCTQSDKCLSGTCVGSNPVSCTVAPPCHLAGTCNPASGLCSYPVAPNGTPCDLGTLPDCDVQASGFTCCMSSTDPQTAFICAGSFVCVNGSCVLETP